jgi:lipid-A-disaccharide synthase
MQSGDLQLAVVAAEASGDVLAASLLRGLAERCAPAGRLQAGGIGGPAMAAAGFDAWWSIDELSVRGYVEVLREYPRLRRLRNDLRDRLLAQPPDLFVGVDAPDFNLDLELALRRAGVRTAHFIGPSVWAWRRERLARVREAVDHMLLIFPFEPPLYEEAGIPATYVGHPLADVIDEQVDAGAARRALGLPADAPVVALLPGSRAAEIRYMAAEFIATAAWLAARRPELRFVLPAAGERQYESLRELLSRSPGAAAITLTQGRSHDALAACDVALVASGTATLETALFKRPMVIAYRMAAISYLIMRKMGYQPWIGLPNILCQEFVVPEFVQGAARADAMGPALLAQLDDPALRERIAARFADLHGQLRRNCAARSAEVLFNLAGPRP